MKAKHWYLKPFVGDWATKEALRDYLSGKRGYRRRNNDAGEEDGSSDFGNIVIGSDDNLDNEGDEDENGEDDKDMDSGVDEEN